jgi:hypothetical protein
MRELDQDFDDVPARGNPRVALIVFLFCLAVLLGPSLLVWTIRGVGFAAQCAPGPDLCRGMTLGGGLRDALSLAWSVGTDIMLVLVLTTIIAVSCFAARRILSGVLCLLLLPMLPSLLPMLAVFVSRYDGCAISPDGVGDCTLWGASMGRSFHIAAGVPDMIYGFVPYSFALALMVGLVGWFFSRPKSVHATAHRATAATQRFDD